MQKLAHERCGLSASYYRPLGENDVRKIADAAFRVLEKSGLLVYSPTALEAFKKAGASVDTTSKIVRLPRALVEDAIASNPSSITLYSRDGAAVHLDALPGVRAQFERDSAFLLVDRNNLGMNAA